MSRIGKQPIPIPNNVSVERRANLLWIKGPKGELALAVAPQIIVDQKDGHLLVKRQNDDRTSRSLHGLTRTLIANMVTGVTAGWQKTLELVGIGYRAKLEGDTLVLSLGFSHPVKLTPPAGIKFAVDENRITISGIDKALVGQVAANLRALKKPEPYKGKGIRYLGEKIKTKPGKTVKAGGGLG